MDAVVIGVWMVLWSLGERRGDTDDDDADFLGERRGDTVDGDVGFAVFLGFVRGWDLFWVRVRVRVSIRPV